MLEACVCIAIIEIQPMHDRPNLGPFRSPSNNIQSDEIHLSTVQEIGNGCFTNDLAISLAYAAHRDQYLNGLRSLLLSAPARLCESAFIIKTGAFVSLNRVSDNHG